jgi:hypothetical protein
VALLQRSQRLNLAAVQHAQVLNTRLAIICKRSAVIPVPVSALEKKPTDLTLKLVTLLLAAAARARSVMASEEPIKLIGQCFALNKFYPNLKK